MKKYLSILIFVMFSFFINTYLVNAAKAVAGCEYAYTTLNGSQMRITLGVDSDKAITFSPKNNVLYCAKGNNKCSLGDNDELNIRYKVGYKNKSGKLVVRDWNKANDDAKNSLINEIYDGNKIGQCPKLTFVETNKADLPYFLDIYYGLTFAEVQAQYPFFSSFGVGPTNGNYAKIEVVKGSLDIKDTSKQLAPKKEETMYCSHSKYLQNAQKTFYVDFIKDSDGALVADVYFDGDQSHASRIVYRDKNNKFVKEATTYTYASTTYTIFIDENWNNVKAFWSDSCKSTNFYLNAPGGTSQPNVFTVTSVNPGVGANPADWSGTKDDGSDTKGDESGSNAEIGSWDPNKLCGGSDNCSIKLTKFCTDPYVARTLKFLGLLLSIAKILVPAIIIILGIVDLLKIITSGNEDTAKKQAKNIFLRIIIGIGIFIIPTVLVTVYNVAYNIANGKDENASADTSLKVPKNFKNCVNCVLDPDKCEITTTD